MDDNLIDNEIRETLMRYLKETFKVYSESFSADLPEIKLISIHGKSYFVKNNKKFLVNKIFNNLPESFGHLNPKLVRQTIKKFIDQI